MQYLPIPVFADFQDVDGSQPEIRVKLLDHYYVRFRVVEYSAVAVTELTVAEPILAMASGPLRALPTPHVESPSGYTVGLPVSPRTNCWYPPTFLTFVRLNLIDFNWALFFILYSLSPYGHIMPPFRRTGVGSKSMSGYF